MHGQYVHGKISPAKFLITAEKLLELQEDDGSFRYPFPWRHYTSNVAYNFETMVLGRQTSGTAGTIGDTFAYKLTGCFVRNSDGSFTVLGTPTRTLIGRSAGMSGDGLTTGVRVAWDSSFIGNAAHLRMDGLTDTTFVITTYNVIQEMGL